MEWAADILEVLSALLISGWVITGVLVIFFIIACYLYDGEIE